MEYREHRMFSTERIPSDRRRQKTVAGCIVDLIRFGWKLSSPQLIISVTDGAHLFKIASPRTRYAFQRGLTTVAVTTGKHIFGDDLPQLKHCYLII